MMTVIVKKYGRWDETCNWQLESRKEKSITEDFFKYAKEELGYTYSERYNELFLISEDKHKMIVITVK